MTLHDYHANSFALEKQGISIGAERWAIVSTYCYVRRFYPSAWFHEIRPWKHDLEWRGGARRFMVFWSKSYSDLQQCATLVSDLWPKDVANQPAPTESLEWILGRERESDERRARASKEPKPGRKKRKQHDDELLLAASQGISFKREYTPEQLAEKKAQEELLDNLF